MSPSSVHWLALVALAASGLTIALPAQTTVHVAPWGDDVWSGLTNATAGPNGPKRTLQAAILATPPGGVVLAADGIYSGFGNRDLDLGGRTLTVRSRGGAAVCVIDCGGSAAEPHRAFWCHTGEGLATVIEGFTITGGVAGFGGALLCESGTSPTVRWCHFVANTAHPTTTGGEGGAIRCVGGSPRLHGCRFEDNRALRLAGVGGRGGAIQFVGGAPVLSDCQFVQNTAGGGGGVHATSASSPTLTRCRFEGNWTADPNFNGGAGWLGSLGGLHTFVDCRFVANTTARIAGAIWVTQGTALRVERGQFLDNHGYDGGCVGVANGSTATIRDSLFAGNTADTFSAALEVWNGPPTGAPSTATVTNCTFADNTSALAGHGVIVVSHTSQVTGSNNVLWGNAPAAIALFDSASVAFDWSNVEGGWPGIGNLAADPLFATAGNRPYALGEGSPCIDAGDPAFTAPGARDIAGAARLWDGDGDTTMRVDIGAYEFRSVLGDFDGDGLVTGSDIKLLAGNLGLSAGAWWSDGDLDGDEDVDCDDLVLLLAVAGSGWR